MLLAKWNDLKAEKLKCGIILTLLTDKLALFLRFWHDLSHDFLQLLSIIFSEELVRRKDIERYLQVEENLLLHTWNKDFLFIL